MFLAAIPLDNPTAQVSDAAINAVALCPERFALLFLLLGRDPDQSSEA